MRKNNYFRFLHSVLGALLTFAALTTGQTAWAADTFQVGVGISGRTNGTQSAYTIGSSYVNLGQYGPINGTEVYFGNNTFDIGSNSMPITMNVYGTITFANSESMTDVTAAYSAFKLTFTSTTKYFTGASVTTKAGAAVSGCSVKGNYSQELTVSIPANTTFGNIILTLATHTPLEHCTISGIETSYIDDGVNQPVPTVTLEGQTLQQDVDYTLSYSHGNTTGTVTVTGTGDYHTGLAADGTLYLYFKNATEGIKAGQPYIVKWETTGTDITNPVFQGVTVTSTTPSPVGFTGGSFVGQYSPFPITSSNRDQIILLGSDNKLGYSQSNRDLRPFRAHFEVPASTPVKAYKMNFGDEETETGIISLTEMNNEQGKVKNEADAWYDMSGRKLEGKPNAKGIYINNGKKVIVK